MMKKPMTTKEDVTKIEGFHSPLWLDGGFVANTSNQEDMANQSIWDVLE